MQQGRESLTSAMNVGAFLRFKFSLFHCETSLQQKAAYRKWMHQ